MNPRIEPALFAGGVLTAVAALAHLGCIVFGGAWYRFFGAGERMARMADAGDPTAAVITASIAAVLAIWALYALSAAGAMAIALPWPRLALCAIAGVYLLRGFGGMGVALFARTGQGTAFWWWSSAICLALGGLHALGLARVWGRF